MAIHHRNQRLGPNSTTTRDANQARMADQNMKLSETAAGKTISLEQEKCEAVQRQQEAELARLREKFKVTSRQITERMNQEVKALELQLEELVSKLEAPPLIRPSPTTPIPFTLEALPPTSFLETGASAPLTAFLATRAPGPSIMVTRNVKEDVSFSSALYSLRRKGWTAVTNREGHAEITNNHNDSLSISHSGSHSLTVINCGSGMLRANITGKGSLTVFNCGSVTVSVDHDIKSTAHLTSYNDESGCISIDKKGSGYLTIMKTGTGVVDP
ncbi:uncharacterized protein BDV14DRAFT_204945 [Aspergillus stella-maris]|uniref:uncharacterized protein n=1 Tax=Aspergillus stella-maris TaxID=1810926 RepID=UPI003CCDA15E